MRKIVDPPPPDPPPDWERLSVDLLCPRCGYNLKLLAAPRCPECGLRSTWRELVAAAELRTLSPLFEYQWRRRPVRSFFRTLGESMLPWMIWQTATLTAKPRIGPLIAFSAGVFGLTTALLGAVYVATEFATATRFGIGGGWRSVVGYVSIACHSCLVGWAAHLLLAACLFGSALVLQKTLHRFRIRPGHLVRVAVCTSSGMMMWSVLAWCVYMALDALSTGIPVGARWFERSAEALSLACLATSLAFAWTLYFRVAWGALDGALVLVLAAFLFGTFVYALLGAAIPSVPLLDSIPDFCEGVWPMTWRAIQWFGGTVLGFN